MAACLPRIINSLGALRHPAFFRFRGRHTYSFHDPLSRPPPPSLCLRIVSAIVSRGNHRTPETFSSCQGRSNGLASPHYFRNASMFTHASLCVLRASGSHEGVLESAQDTSRIERTNDTAISVEPMPLELRFSNSFHPR